MNDENLAGACYMDILKNSLLMKSSSSQKCCQVILLFLAEIITARILFNHATLIIVAF